MTNKDESGKITRSPRNDDKNRFETEKKKFEKLFKKVLTKGKRSDIIDKLTQKGWAIETWQLNNRWKKYKAKKQVRIQNLSKPREILLLLKSNRS